MELTDLLTQGNFQMKFQNFVDEFVKQKTKQMKIKKRNYDTIRNHKKCSS